MGRWVGMALFGRWWTNWWRLWRDKPVRIQSGLAPAAAAARLNAAKDSWWKARTAGRGIQIVGRASHGSVRLRTLRPWMRNAWSPVLRARIVQAPGGCELLGSLGWPPAVRVFTALWLLAVDCFALTGMVSTVAAVVRGRWSVVGGLLGFTAMTLAMAAFGVLLVTIAGWVGHRDTHVLLNWLETLVGQPTVRPCDPDLDHREGRDHRSLRVRPSTPPV